MPNRKRILGELLKLACGSLLAVIAFMLFIYLLFLIHDTFLGEKTGPEKRIEYRLGNEKTQDSTTNPSLNTRKNLENEMNNTSGLIDKWKKKLSQ